MRPIAPAMIAAMIAATLGSMAAGCGASFRPYPRRAAMWFDDDMRPFATRPDEQYTAPRWDTLDQTLFRQASGLFEFERAREAINVNALDEVPDSSWFENRIGRSPMSDAELAQGPCPADLPPPRPWTVIRGKPDGTSPGVVVRAADGRTFLFKIDFAGQPERATAADAMATRVLHAAGYYTACNIVVSFTPADFDISPDARTSGTDEPYTQQALDALIEAAEQNADGTRRGSLSLFIEGVPLGGWRFDGRLDGDLNDVIDHQHRRELRGFYVFSAWLNHVDSRAENNMAAWIEVDDELGYVRHYVLDAGDSFGIVWSADSERTGWSLSERFGQSTYLDLEHVLGDFLSLGAIPRRYRDPTRGPYWEVFGFYDVGRFVADEWRPGYPNPAFERRTERDCAWAARIIAAFDRRAIRAIGETGRFTRPALTDEFVRLVAGRRRRILERWLTRLSPLTEPQVEDDQLCLRDLAVQSGTRSASSRVHEAEAWSGLPPRPSTVGEPSVAGEGSERRVCVRLPSAGRASYHIIDVRATSGQDHTAPARVHLYETDDHRYEIAALERPEHGGPAW